jgi:hypothetical protein
MDIQERRTPVSDLLESGGASAGEPPPPPVVVGVPPADAAPRVWNYVEIEGQEGRGVFFRPHRYTAADLAPLQGTIAVSLGGAEHACALRDVSQNGAAVAWPAELAVAPRDRLAIVLRFDGHEAFRGAAQVGSVREGEEGTIVGISFVDFLLDVDEILQLRTVRRWTAAIDADVARRATWRESAADHFKATVADLEAFFEAEEQQLTDLERQLPWYVLQGGDNPARAALASALRGGFVAEALRLTERIDAAVREVAGQHASAAAKEWSLRNLDRFLMQAPVLHRARHKPFGYPGDYEVMNLLYEGNFEGANLFARAVNLTFTSTRAAHAVRARKDLVKERLKALLASRAGTGKPVRVLSIAAGPAQELVELFHEVTSLDVPLEIVLFEQDKNALAHAWRRLKGMVEARFAGAVQLTFLHDSIKRLLRDPDIFSQFGVFDLAYSCGLFDYLQQRTAVVLTRHLAASMAPGGQLLVANMVDNPTRWILDQPLEWPLIYRTHEELLDIGRRAMPGAPVRLLEEASGANPFFELTRP